MSTRSYKDAVEHLNSLQSNAATLEALRASGGRSSDLAHPEMIEYLGRIGYTPEDLNKLNVLHVTGTKGKGSTSAFVDSILRHVKPQWTTGLYTSPHLVAVRERIRINGAPISEEVFTRFFFEVWDRLEHNNKTPQKILAEKPRPGYFRYMTLLAFHTFLSLKVNATVLEVGVGGRYDSTNIVPKPIVTGITALGLDHTMVLGKTLKEIAWQKGGIYKANAGVPALTVNQPEEGMEVLKKQAEDSKASEFLVVPWTPEISAIKLGLAGVHQVQNAHLAVFLVNKFLQIREPDGHWPILSEDVVAGLENTKWPGRCQTVRDPKHPDTTWFIDGAHTVESLECCVQWFVSPGIGLPVDPSSKRALRVLIFNCTNGRSGNSFLGTVQDKVATQLKLHERDEDPVSFFDHVVFCSNVTYADGAFKGDIANMGIPDADRLHLKTQHELATAWASLLPSFPPENIHVLPSIEHAVNVVRSSSSGDRENIEVLVAGSLHLVGGVIEVAGLSAVAL
ncbi:hypothetical protein PLICRDRAFT_99170 [Plicaturopsis crispa FD-325 SS-3]|nr:hypothetical protein PLICRDRAFT_99170 [Plicaturopsis crispa FD-325 SS-3]